MFGFLLIDKPTGETSFSCLKKIRRMAGIKRCGFVGTLDPLATGLLMFALGEATKLIPLLEGQDKTYETVIELGFVSDTYDADGEVVACEVVAKPSRDQIDRILREDFLGKRMQMPPVYSAIKIDGRRAYDMARKGEKVNLKERTVEFLELEVLSYEWPLLSLRVHCSSGTYIRSLAHDIGQRLSCGGYVKELRRTKIGKDSVENAVDLNDLTEENLADYLVAPEAVMHDVKTVQLSDEEVEVLNAGGFLDSDYGVLKGEVALAYNNKVCVGSVEVVKRDGKGRLKFKRKLNIVS